MPLKMAPLGEEVEIKRLAADDKVKGIWKIWDLP